MIKDSLINQQLKASYLEASIYSKLNDLSYKALNGTRQPMRGTNENIVELGKMAFKNQPTDEITEERIMDYKKSLDNPARIDPTTGDAFKFYDVPNVALNAPPPLTDDPDLSRPATKTDVDDIDTQINKIIATNIPYIEAEIIKVKDRLIIENENLRTAKTKAQRDRANINIKTYEIRLTNFEKDLQDEKDKITDLETIKQQYKDNIKENEKIINQNRIDNENTVKKYVEDLKAVNRDKFFIEQQPNESLSDYLTRVQTLQNEKLDKTLYDDKAKLEQITRLKENLKLMIKSDVIIENVVKVFTDVEIFEINKNFNTIRDNFLDAYGYNNKNINDMDIVNFIKDTLNNISSIEIDEEALPTTITPNTSLVDLMDASGAKTKYSSQVIDNAFYVINNDTNKYIYLKIGLYDNGKNKIVLYSKTTNDKGHFTQVIERKTQGKSDDDKWINIYMNYLQLDAYAFKEFFNSLTKLPDLYDYLETTYILKPVSGKSVRLTQGSISRGYGVGIKSINDIPKHIDFGNVVLLLNQLYFKNRLSIKYKSLSEIKGFKSVKVSDNFVDLIMNIINGKEYTDKIKLLKTDEKELFNLLLYKSGIHKIVPNETDDVRQKLKERFLITEGEIRAGNNNPAVFKELEDLTWKISHLGGFSKKVAEAYLKQFK